MSLGPQGTSTYAYGSDQPLPVDGRFTADVSHKSCVLATEFVVSQHGDDTLLGYQTATELGLVQIASNVSEDGADPRAVIILQKFSDRFTGIGKLAGTQIKLHEDKSVLPVTQPHRRIPHHVRQKVEEEINRLLELDIIERVSDEPTPWISPIHVVQKPKNPDQIRICVDMRAANEAIKRERHITPTIDDVIGELNNAKVFSKLDLNAGYHQVELAVESRHLTVFSTHIGLFRYKHLNSECVLLLKSSRTPYTPASLV